MLAPGTMLGGRYRLEDRFAGGGMGDVWRGTDEVLGRTVAVKTLLSSLLEEPGFVERFRGEARTMATINHPGVVDIYDYGNESGTAFLVMEYVEGDTLSRTLHRVGRLTPARTMALVAQAADALQAAHSNGIVHRDVKPGNLLVRPNGTLVLTDFGIARSAQAAQLTAAGSVLGTASYISPEQAAGEPATALSDVYALGVVAYQCLSGRRPFEGDNPLELAMKHVRETPPPLPADIPPQVQQIVERAMAKDPAARWPTASALAQVARAAAARLSASGGTAAVITGGPAAGPLTGTGHVAGAGAALPPVSGGPQPSMPISGPPTPGDPAAGGQAPTSVSPAGAPAMTSGAPASGAPNQAGTRVMLGKVGAGQPGAGSYVRGAAAAPQPPMPPADTGYTYAAPSGQRPGEIGVPPSRRTLLIIAASLATLVVVLAVSGGTYLLLSHDNNDGSGDDSANTKSSTPATSATTDRVGCADLVGKPYQQVKLALEERRYKVNPVGIDGQPRYEVVELAPCDAEAGATITVKVYNGKAKPSGNHGSSPTRGSATTHSSGPNGNPGRTTSSGANRSPCQDLLNPDCK